MKTIFVLFACFAATCVASECYGNIRLERVSFPCFDASITCKSSWYSCDTTIDVKYPTDQCTAASPETPVDDLVATYEGLLATLKTTIDGEITTEKDAAITRLQTAVTTFTTNSNTAIETYIAALKAEYPDDTTFDAKEIALKAQVTAQAASYTTTYTAQIEARATAISARVGVIHTTLAANYRSCLETRLTKIAAFDAKMVTNVATMKSDFAQKLAARKTKYLASFKTLIGKVCAEADTTALETLYGSVLDAQIAIVQAEYDGKVDTYGDTLKGNYKCAYVCDGCRNLCFNRSIYPGACQRICLENKLTGVCGRFRKYDYKLRLCEYNNLCTCDTDAVNQTETEVETAIASTITTKVAAATAGKTTWEADEAAKNTQAVTTFETDMATAYATELETLKTTLDTDQDGLLNEEGAQEKYDAREAAIVTEKSTKKTAYETRLASLLTTALTYYDTAVTNYQTRLNAIKTQIVTRYGQCLTSRTTSITNYTTKLDGRIAAMRTCAENMLKKYRDHNVACFTKLLTAYVGEDNKEHADVTAATSAYETKLSNADTTKLGEFDTFWETEKPKLIENFTCKAKCTAATFNPCDFVFKYNICRPKYVHVTYSCYYTPASCYGNFCSCV